jgi:serine/threonine protein kinase
MTAQGRKQSLLSKGKVDAVGERHRLDLSTAHRRTKVDQAESKPRADPIRMKPPEPTAAGLNDKPPDSPTGSAARALPVGTWLGEFEVEEIIGEGRATIVYAATDPALGVPVAISEYMPARHAQRNDEAQVTPRTPAQADAFANGLKAFIYETRMLARCDHPSLVRILRLWEANGTAYRVMPRYPPRRLLEVRRGMNEPPDEAALRALLDALLGALQAFHDAGGCHGKVTPSNILLLADNRPLLLGPGAAGRAIASDGIDAPMTSVEPCFAPIEQIVEPDIPLPPSVDLYALAGVARYWISGQLPAPAFLAPSTARRETLADMLQRLRLTWPRLHYSACLVDALDSALSIYPAERPQSVEQMRARLDTARPPAGEPVSAAWTASPVPNDAAPSSPAPAPRPAPLQDLDTVMAFAPDPAPLATSDVARNDDDPSVRTVFAREVPSSRRIALWIGGVLVLLAMLTIGVYEFRQELQVGRVLDVLGIGRGTGAGDNAAVSASAAGAADPVTAGTAADAGTAMPKPTEPTATDSPAGATAPESPASAPIAAEAGAANPTPTEPTATDSPTGATAPASADSPNRATLADAARTAPAAGAQPPALTPPPMHVTQQQASPPANPREACGERTQFSLYRCMQTQCSQRRWVSHAQCEHLRITDSVD